MAIDVNIPSQVKNYANLAAFPATGTLKTIFIAEDTNKTYRWTGSAYVEISATAASTWGAIGGTLSNQTDLQTALNAKQDTLVSATNIKTINGTTLLGSGDLVVGGSSAIAIGTTAITSGTVGRVLFEGTGNVVQESAGLAYNDTTRVFTLLGPIGSFFQHTPLTNYNGFGGLQLNVADGTERAFVKLQPNSGEFKIGTTGSGYFTTIHSGGVERVRVFSSTGNIGINTTTDAGFKLDVNGTARVSGLITATQNNIHATHVGANIKGLYIVNNADSVVRAGLQFDGSTAFVELVGRYNNGTPFFRQDGGNGNISFLRSGVEFGRIFGATGNFAINTTTDAGFKLDVNGTARVVTKVVTPILEGVSSGRVDLKYGFGTSTPSTNILSVGYGGEPAILIGSGTTQNSSMIQMNSTTQGFLPPRMTTTQVNAISLPAEGLVVYNTTISHLCVYQAGAWVKMNHSPM